MWVSGNFAANGLNENPTERLDVDGTARLRQMPTAASPNVLITGFDQDVNPTPGDYVLNYLDFSGDQGDYLAGDGTWQTLDFDPCGQPVEQWNTSALGLGMATGYVGACMDGNVAIGLPVAANKLFVYDQLQPGENTTNRILSDGAGVTNNWGLRSAAQDGIDFVCGVEGLGIPITPGDGNVPYKQVFGVRGIANLQDLCFTEGYGVYGEIQNVQSSCAGGWAGFFAGNVFTTAAYYSSDENLKENITSLDGAIEILQQLNPKSYTFKTEEYSQLSLPEGNHFGIMAQEIESIAPDMVKETHYPGRYNDDGELTAEPVDFKSVNYNELIPILVAAVKEQQTQIDAQQAQLDALSSELAACCASGMDARSGEVQDDIRMESLPAKHSLEQNAPNPFTTSTTLRFTMGSDAHARVCIYNGSGQIIDCLVDGTRAAGQHRVDWNTSDLAPGVYFYSLEVDGFEQVRRAVKL